MKIFRAMISTATVSEKQNMKENDKLPFFCEHAGREDRLNSENMHVMDWMQALKDRAEW